MTTELNMKYDVMSRVKTVRLVRTLASSPLMSGLVGVILLCCMSILVSVGDVFANTMAHVDWSTRLSYAFSSLLHSRLIVQTLAGLFIFSMLAGLVNFIRKIPVRKIFIPFGSTQQI